MANAKIVVELSCQHYTILGLAMGIVNEMMEMEDTEFIGSLREQCKEDIKKLQDLIK